MAWRQLLLADTWQRPCKVVMGRGLVPVVAGGFELERGVRDADWEVFGYAGLEGVEQPGRVSIVEAFVVDDHVGAQDREPGGDLGGVEVMDAADVVDLQDVASDAVQVKAGWRGLEEDLGGAAQRCHGSRKDQDTDQQGDQGVGPGPAGGGHHDGGRDHRD